jgi:hypothetical protein
MNLKECSVSCSWCGAKEHKMCRGENGLVISDVHRSRMQLYDLVNPHNYRRILK